MLEVDAFKNVTASPAASDRCPACGARGLSVFYEIEGVPVRSCIVLDDAEEARTLTRGDIRLGFCRACGFIANTAFDPSTTDSTRGDDGSRHSSPRASAIVRSLASKLIDRYDLHGKDILEIGCGAGDFLVLLCELGDNQGLDIDPALAPHRISHDARNVRFIRDEYTETYRHLSPDFICCRHTLERIADVSSFVRLVRRSIGDRSTPVFVEVPDVLGSLRGGAFWDLHHERCSHFSLPSLTSLFRGCGFDVSGLSTDFDDECVLLEACPAYGSAAGSHPQDQDVLSELASAVELFRARCAEETTYWIDELRRMSDEGRRPVIWGAGAKAVAFLTHLDATATTGVVADLDPSRHGRFMPGSGCEIVSPEVLTRHDVVLVLNPLDLEDIRRELDDRGRHPELRAVPASHRARA